METIALPNDIKVFYVTAKSFPDGIVEAYDKLHALIPPSSGRKYYGISRPENGAIVYKAAIEEITPGEAEEFGLHTLILKKGDYICTTLNDWLKDTSEIGRIFSELLTHPGLDPEGYCVEYYFNDKDVRCMVRLND